MSLVRNAVESKVEINVDYKVLKDFLNIVKGFEDSVDIVNFSESGLIRSTDGYTVHWVKVENLTNVSVNVSRNGLLNNLIEVTKLGKKLENTLDKDYLEVVKKLKETKNGIVKITIEPSEEVKLNIKQDRVNIYLNNDLIGSFLQPVEMVLPDLDRALNGMKFNNLIGVSEYATKTLIKELKDLKKELGSKLFKDYTLEINTSSIGLKLTPVLKNEYVIKHNETPIYMKSFFVDCLSNTDVKFNINAKKLLNYLLNMSSKTVEIELNKGMDYVNDIEMFTCAKFNDNTFIMLCRK